jgi:hypothetical protein
MTDQAPEFIFVRRQWSDSSLVAKVRLSDLSGFHLDDRGGGYGRDGGFGNVAPRPFLHAYVWCNAIVSGEVGHSCMHGPPPHHIKVCITKKDNTRIAFAAALTQSQAVKR